MKIHDLTPGSENVLSHFFEMIGSYLSYDCRDLIYLGYIDFKNRENLSMNYFPLIGSVALLIKGYIFGYEEIYVVLSMVFLLH